MDERKRNDAATKAGRALGVGCSVALVVLMALVLAIAIVGAWRILMGIVAL